MSKPIHQTVSFSASPDRVYQAYLDADSHASFTGRPAEITDEQGAEFSVHGGMVLGRNIELVDGRRIVQAWRAGDWDEGVYSVVRIELRKDSNGTELTLHHDAFPEGAREQLDKGWAQMYWNPMEEYLSRGA